ncbi:unnamed protein product [Prorocentrum cordatum]|uniref:Uncharacterized protein n=1 Tax=Prorocentrum cordatum TaxID=2364126 RepID=A0ABN9YBK4_9DINO|nr:unnamed protein product [Polarella glacialis]
MPAGWAQPKRAASNSASGRCKEHPSYLPRLLDLSVQSAISAAVCARQDTVVNLSCPAPPAAQVELHCPEVKIPPVQVQCISEGPGVVGYLAYGLARLALFLAGWVCGALLAVPTLIGSSSSQSSRPVVMTRVGDVLLLKYNVPGPALWHERIVLAVHPTDAGHYYLLTPDDDAYIEDCSPASADVERIRGAAGLGDTPHGLGGDQIYRFRGPPAVEELRQQLIDAALALGLPGVQVAGAAAPAPRADLVWVAAEDAEDLPKGTEIDITADTVAFGDRAIMPWKGGFVSLRQLTRPEIYRFTYDDLRVLPVQFDSSGARRVAFGEGVQRQDDTLPAGGLDLQCPRTAAWFCRYIAENGPTPQAAHEAWLRKAKLHDGDRAIHEHFVLSQVLSAAVCHDQLNVPALKSMEMVVRRLQLIKSAYAQSASAPDFSGADHFMGWRPASASASVASELAAHVATKFRDEAAILKDFDRYVDASRQRDLFPLPAVEVDERPDPGLSATVFKRLSRRRSRQLLANGVIDTLNDLASPAAISTFRPTAAHRAAHGQVLSTLAARPSCTSMYKDREALKALCGSEFSYAGGDSSCSVEPYDRGRVSMPAAGASPPWLTNVIDPSGRGVVDGFTTAMLRSPVEMGAIMDQQAFIKPYMDVRLKRDRSLYYQFVRDLFESNLVDFGTEAFETVYPFFRLAWDCRVANIRWRSPPKIRMASGSAFAGLQIPPELQEQGMWGAGSDIADYFFWLAMPPEMRPFFALPPVPGALLLEWGVPARLGGDLHGLLEWRSDLPVLNVYCDNLMVLAATPDSATAARDAVIAQLRGSGFLVHEVFGPVRQFTALGYHIDGEAMKVWVEPMRRERIAAAARALSRRPRITGLGLSRFIGHCIAAFLIFRPGLSVFRRMCDFASKMGAAPGRLWGEAVREARQVSYLIQVTMFDLCLEWSDRVVATDACLSGYAVAATRWPQEVIKSYGTVREKWRYRSTLPSATAPRDAALPAFADPFTDINTVKTMIEPKTISPYEPNPDFAEINPKYLQKGDWKLQYASRFRGRDGPISPVQRTLRPAQEPPSRSQSGWSWTRRTMLASGDATRRARAASRASVAGASGAKAVAGQDTFLESSSVSAKTYKDYEQRHTAFQEWVSTKQLAGKLEKELDLVLTDYVNLLWKNGHDVLERTKMLAAFMYFHPDYSKAGTRVLPRARKALKGWTRLEPGKTRPPVPLHLLALLWLELINMGNPLMALALVTMWVAYLRPGEAMRLKEKSLVSPPRTTSAVPWSLHMHEEMDQHPSKVNLFEESLVLVSIDLPWLGHLLAGLRRGQSDRLLFDFKYPLLGPALAKAAKAVGLEKLKITAYHMRHSDPSHDILFKRRSLPAVKARGRWLSDRTVRRYEAHGRLLQQQAQVSDDTNKKGALALDKLQAAFRISLFPQAGASSRGAAPTGIPAEAWDIEQGEAADFLKLGALEKLEKEIVDGLIRFIWFGLPCQTWSKARRWEGEGQAPSEMIRNTCMVCLISRPKITNTIIEGKDAQGVWRTAMAQPYPVEFCALLAQLVAPAL